MNIITQFALTILTGLVAGLFADNGYLTIAIVMFTLVGISTAHLLYRMIMEDF